MSNPVTIGEILESMVDGASLSRVLELLREICYGKARHLAENWQDETSVKEWDKAAKLMDEASYEATKLGIPQNRSCTTYYEFFRTTISSLGDR